MTIFLNIIKYTLRLPLLLLLTIYHVIIFLFVTLYNDMYEMYREASTIIELWSPYKSPNGRW